MNQKKVDIAINTIATISGLYFIGIAIAGAIKRKKAQANSDGVDD